MTANKPHWELFAELGYEDWNRWRESNSQEKPQLQKISRMGTDTRNFNLAGVDLSWADLIESDFSNTDLSGADMTGVDARGCKFRCANLSGANLTGAVLNDADLSGANLMNCRVHGVSAWKLRLDGTVQKDLLITTADEAEVTIDNVEVAQFIYLLLRNENFRKVIDTVTSKVVLILGRFSGDRKKCLDAIREELRRLRYIPVMFDFEKPNSKDLTGTVETLARLARFIVADLTDPSSIPYELGTIVPFLRTTPILPLRLAGSPGFGMFEDLRVFDWVLETYDYQDCQGRCQVLSVNS